MLNGREGVNFWKWAMWPLAPHKPGWKQPLCSQSGVLCATGLGTWPLGPEGTWETKEWLQRTSGCWLGSGSELQLAQGAGLWLCLFRCCCSCSSIPGRHQGTMLHCAGNTPHAGTLRHRICLCLGRDPPVPSRECTWQRVPPHPGPPNSACCSSLSPEQRQALGLFQLQQRSPRPALRAGGMHSCRGMLSRAPTCLILQPAPLQNHSIAHAMELKPCSYCRGNL